MCIVDGCENGGRIRRGMCNRCYLRWHKVNFVPSPVPFSKLTGRFWAKVKKGGPNDCWLWTGGLHNKGYGIFTIEGRKSVYAHRFAYELLIGPIPNGLTIDHVKEWGCTSKACVNPAHMEPVTLKENHKRYLRNKYGKML